MTISPPTAPPSPPPSLPPSPSIARLLAVVFLPFAGGYFLSYLFRSTNAVIAPELTAEIGLDDLGRHDGYVQRQLRTWYGSWNSSIEAASYDDPRVHSLHDRLLTSVPDAGPARVVHGDYGLHNVMLDHDGSVAAVLDWEIATLGDPLADFAYSLNAWTVPASPAGPVEGPTAAPGIVAPEALIERYGQQTGADLSRLNYYRAFNSLKTACILHGVYARYRMGQKSTEGVDMDGLFNRLVLAIDLASAAAEAEGI